MTGRDLMLFILENHLEDAEIIDKYGDIKGFVTADKLAAKFGVGSATIHVWFGSGRIPGLVIGGILYLPENAVDPRTKIENLI